MITQELLSILVCPENRMLLSLADESLLKRAEPRYRASPRLTNIGGEPVTEKLSAVPLA